MLYNFVAEKVVYVRAPKRERAEKIDLDVFIDSALAAAAIAVIYFVGWPLVQKFMKGELKLPDLSNLKLPTRGGGTTQSTGGSTAATGSQWYKASGSTTTLPASRQDGQSNRWSKNVTGWSDGFEVMGYLTCTGMQSGSHIGLKMAGPNHTSPCGYQTGGACCCWWDGGLRRNGAGYLEIEYPHPNNKNTKMIGSIGRNIDAGMLGIRWLNAREGNGRRVMFWIDKSGQANAHKWEEVFNVLDTGQFMPTSYYTKIPGTIELEIRISDIPAKNIKWATGPIARKI